MAKNKEVKKLKREWLCKNCKNIIYWDGYEQTWMHVESGEMICAESEAAPLLNPGEVFDDE